MKNKKKSTPSDLENLAMRVSSKIEEVDVRGAVRLTVSDESLAPYDDTTVHCFASSAPNAGHARR